MSSGIAQLEDKDAIVFDGVCVLCNRSMRFVLWADRNRRFHLITAQSPLGQSIYRELGLESENFDTFVVITDGQTHTKLDGILAILSAIGWPWRAAAVLKLLPRSIRDWLYDRIARNRYAVFGRRDTCMIPGPDVRARFLD